MAKNQTGLDLCKGEATGHNMDVSLNNMAKECSHKGEWGTYPCRLIRCVIMDE